MATLSPELHGREAAPVLDVCEVQLLEPAHHVSLDQPQIRKGQDAAEPGQFIRERQKTRKDKRRDMRQKNSCLALSQPQGPLSTLSLREPTTVDLGNDSQLHSRLYI